jgi:hypothetical protein
MKTAVINENNVSELAQALSNEGVDMEVGEDKNKLSEQTLIDYAMSGALHSFVNPWYNPFGHSRIYHKPPKQDSKCMLPECNNMTKHNGGYCCADHCKQHRNNLKGKNKSV